MTIDKNATYGNGKKRTTTGQKPFLSVSVRPGSRGKSGQKFPRLYPTGIGGFCPVQSLAVFGALPEAVGGICRVAATDAADRGKKAAHGATQGIVGAIKCDGEVSGSARVVKRMRDAASHNASIPERFNERS